MAFVIGLLIFAVGAVGILAPSGLVWLARHAVKPLDLYLIAAFRVALGLLLLSVASASRAPRALRVFAFIPIVAGLATPLVGVDHAPAMIDWWSQQGAGLVRLTALLVLALGSFIGYACAPSRSAA